MDQTVIDNLTAQRFIHYLVTPINQWEACRMGIIDSNGNVKRNPQNSNETKFFNMFHTLVLKIKDLLKTSGRGTNWVLPSSAGQYYLGKNMPSANFTNWSISNKAMLPAVGAAYSAMRECILNNDDSLLYEHMEFYLDHPEQVNLSLFEDGNFAGNVSNPIMPIGGSQQNASSYLKKNLEDTKRKQKINAALIKSSCLCSTNSQSTV